MTTERETRENILFPLGFIFWPLSRPTLNHDNIVKILSCFWMIKKLRKINVAKIYYLQSHDKKRGGVGGGRELAFR